ncbi:MBL fold metallo-hydrolase [Thiolinea disciformis]|uniref:MBL fold metallo-hydrolase n=1 Tax=Thiolinea disciformis TaxID=125614 RepID=UPI00037ECCEC|nr:MBL fold metallo-hydrolase [Thiolinea disciformis]
MPQAHYQDLGDGIYCIDTALCRDDFAACYLIVEGDTAAFVDSGTYHSVPLIMQALADVGLKPENVQYVIPTHVHLDHAGGAGELMRLCPKATMIAHPRGATHMIDPAKLIAGASAVYGAEVFARDYGTLTPVPKERLISAEDGFQFNLNGRQLGFYDTPGHANHHGSIFDERTRSWFTGDTFGISYREFDTEQGAWLFATTTPVAFDPESWKKTLLKYESKNPNAMLLTHYSRVTELDRLFPLLRKSLQDMVDIALSEEQQPEGRLARIQEKVAKNLVASAQAHGVRFSAAKIRELLALDIDLNGQGLAIWLQRRAKAA